MEYISFQDWFSDKPTSKVHETNPKSCFETPLKQCVSDLKTMCNHIQSFGTLLTIAFVSNSGVQHDCVKVLKLYSGILLKRIPDEVCLLSAYTVLCGVCANVRMYNRCRVAYRFHDFIPCCYDHCAVLFKVVAHGRFTGLIEYFLGIFA